MVIQASRFDTHDLEAHLHEDFDTLEAAEAFQYGLTYGDEPQWVSALIRVLPIPFEGYRVFFDHPDAYKTCSCALDSEASQPLGARPGQASTAGVPHMTLNCICCGEPIEDEGSEMCRRCTLDECQP